MQIPSQEPINIKSDSELLDMAAQFENYTPGQYIEVIKELERRNLASSEHIQQKTMAMEALEKEIELSAGSTVAKDIVQKEYPSTLDLLKITPRYFYTPLILYANVAIWIIMVISGVNAFDPAVEDLLLWGGNLRGSTVNGELWRLFTSTFVHGGIFHLALNMYAMIQVGALLETKFGNHRYFLCYVAAGILASIASTAVNYNIVSVGASGAIFGLYGLFLALLLTKNIDLPHEAQKNFLSSTGIFIVYNLVFGFMVPGIDNTAHIGGLVSGFIMGMAYYPTLNRPQRSTLISVLIIAIVCAAIFLTPKFISDTYGEYLAAVKIFSRNEEKTLWIHQEEMPDETDTEAMQSYRSRIQTEGIDVWKENLALLTSLKDLPEPVEQRVILLKQYCELRIQYCEAILAEDADQIENVGFQLKQILDQLNK